MKRQLEGENEESERVEAKNSFENTLREVLNNKNVSLMLSSESRYQTRTLRTRLGLTEALQEFSPF